MGAIDYLPHHTYDEYKEWEGDWELIDGVPYAMSPAPVNKHQLLNTKIARVVDEALDPCSRCNAIAEADWKIADDLVLRPDMSIICYEPSDYLTKAPDLIFEIISPSTAIRDEKLKFEIYQKEGVRFYILIYPDTLLAKVFKLHNGQYIKMGDFDTESITFELSQCQIQIDFDKIFKHFKKRTNQ